MIKKIAILGSTGSIGKSLLKIIEKDRKKFSIKLLVAKKNYKELLKQAKLFNVKNVILTDKNYFELHKSKFKKEKIKIYNNYDCYKNVITKRLDYVMSSIVGLNGLLPTISIIKYSKTIAIANKESIICAWNLIKKELKKCGTKFIPVDSEHFSIWYGMQNFKSDNIENFYITASGGPFYMTPIKKFKNIKISDAINHPNWKMGKKISTDSATLMNKLFEVIEAKNIFGIPYKKIEILIHPKSYVHAILKFKNGLIKIIAHDTTMKIPIYNTLYYNNFDKTKIQTKKVNINILNNLNFKKVDLNKFPIIKIKNTLPQNNSLYETVIVSANDTLVNLFLKKKIKFNDITKNMLQIINSKYFLKYKKISPRNLKDIIDLNNYVRLKIEKKVYKSLNI